MPDLSLPLQGKPERPCLQGVVEAVPVEIAQVAVDNMHRHLVIATRGSKLALWQANHVKSMIEKENPSYTVSLNIIRTKGDAFLDKPLAEVGGKGLFVKEIEDAILSGRADMAVHSMKDMPIDLPEGLIIGCVPKREVSSDCFLSDKYPDLMSLPENAVVGTSSMRRQSELLNLRPDLTIIPLRGNIDSRLKKMEDGICDAIFLATAGLYRLELTTRYMFPLSEKIFVPAVGQGALAIECEEENYELLVILSTMEDRASRVCVAAERAFLKELDGDCRIPVGAHAAMIDEENINLAGFIGTPNGKQIIRNECAANAALAEETGRNLAKEMLLSGGNRILNTLKNTPNK